MKLARYTAPFLGLLTGALAIFQTPTLTFNAEGEGLKLGSKDTAPAIRLDSRDWPGVIRAARDLAVDFGRVLGRNGTVVLDNAAASAPLIIVGTIGRSSFIDSLVSAGKIDVSNVRGKWES